MVLADTSAWSLAQRADAPDVKRALDELIVADAVRICDMVRFEIAYSARSAAEMTAVLAKLEVLRDCPVGKAEWGRALDVYRRLAEQGGAHHRSVGHQDLLIAAAAESAEATVLHYDEDFDRIAAITGQPTLWIAERGSI